MSLVPCRWRYAACSLIVPIIALALTACGGEEGKQSNPEPREATRNGVSGSGERQSGEGPAPQREATASDVAKRVNHAWACEDGRAVVSSYSGTDDRLWLFLPDRTIDLAHERSASGARYEGAGVTFWSKGDSATLEDELGSTRCALDRRATPWEDAKLRGADFRGIGNEPGWHLEMFSDGPSVLVSDYGESRYEISLGEPETGPEMSVFRGRSDGLEVIVTLRRGPCQDTMADEEYETRVEVMLGERRLTGCGRALH
jgi:membrane-bound inhibitor of C-type lysozyme